VSGSNVRDECRHRCRIRLPANETVVSSGKEPLFTPSDSTTTTQGKTHGESTAIAEPHVEMHQVFGNHGRSTFCKAIPGLRESLTMCHLSLTARTPFTNSHQEHELFADTHHVTAMAAPDRVSRHAKHRKFNRAECLLSAAIGCCQISRRGSIRRYHGATESWTMRAVVALDVASGARIQQERASSCFAG